MNDYMKRKLEDVDVAFRMTFAQFSALGFDVPDLRVELPDQLPEEVYQEPMPGRLYRSAAGDAYLERNSTTGNYELELVRWGRAGTLEEVEPELYAWYVCEMTHPSVTEYLLDIAPPSAWLAEGRNGRPSVAEEMERLTNVYIGWQVMEGLMPKPMHEQMMDSALSDKQKLWLYEHFERIRNINPKDGYTEEGALRYLATLDRRELLAFALAAGPKDPADYRREMARNIASLPEWAPPVEFRSCLTSVYKAWMKEQGLTLGSADEHLDDNALSDEQRGWLAQFCKRWDAASD